MFKKIGFTAVLSAALLFGGGLTASAASVSDQSLNLSNKAKAYYLVNGEWKEVKGDHFNQFLAKCLPGFQINWNTDKVNKEEAAGNQEKEEPQAKEEPKENPSQEIPAEKTEQPEQAVEQTTEESADTPAEQPKEEPAEQPAEQPAAPSQNTEAQEQPTESEQNQADSELSQYEQEVVELTNNERAKQGLSPLQIDTELSSVAREKSKDMAKNGYFSHTSPTYGSPFDMIKNYGINYQTAGENIAKGQRTPQEVVNAWMNSDGHRANILNGNYTHIGVGFVEQGNHWTQMFIGK